MRDRLTRRSAIQYVLGLSGTALLAACAPAATPGAANFCAGSTRGTDDRGRQARGRGYGCRDARGGSQAQH